MLPKQLGRGSCGVRGFVMSNVARFPAVYTIVKSGAIWGITLVAAACMGAAYSDYLSAKQKFDLIESGRLKAGARVQWSPRELNAYVEKEVPAGVRNPKVQVSGPGVATGTALIDFGKLRRAQGYQPGWLMAKLLDGERPVSVTARIRSAAGQATVDVERVEISGIVLDGGTLDFVIQNFLLPMYPDAAIGRPFELGHRIEKVDVAPSAIGVLIGN
jgi:hypothetical protein